MIQSVVRWPLLLLLAVGRSGASAEIELSPATQFASVDIVDVQSLVPDLLLDIRYAGSNNFVGRPIDGYDVPKCYLHRAAAQALRQVEIGLREHGMRLKIFDCYRPVRAVEHFVRWAEDLRDQHTRPNYYPRLAKQQLLGEYIAPVSGHSRAATLDLTLMNCESGRCVELDMGTPFDFFDPRAHTDAAELTQRQRRHRDRLRSAMQQAGFENYAAEWWHYTFKPEPTPHMQYDIPVR